MNHIPNSISHPYFFERNRVFRVYTGGKLFHEFLGDNSEDGFYPEEWVCSCVNALNEGSDNPNEGISVVRGEQILFTDLLKQYPTEMLGSRKELGILVKLLDSAIRLPVQCHPDRKFSRQYLHSNHGKAESWVILATRENACIYFGFQEKITRSDFEKAVAESEHSKEVMSSLLNRVPVKTGDVFFIEARMIHAIGAGCLLLEVQEPTDFTVQPERMCGDYRLSDYQMYLDIPKNLALDCFDFEQYGPDVIKRGKMQPVTLWQTQGCQLESLISYQTTPCFAVERLTLSDGAYFENQKGAAIYVVSAGEGEIRFGGQKVSVKKGDYFFMPEILSCNSSFYSESFMELLICLPPLEE